MAREYKRLFGHNLNVCLLTCEQCKNSFHCSRSDASYCSKKCRQKASYQRKAEARRQSKIAEAICQAASDADAVARLKALIK